MRIFPVTFALGCLLATSLRAAGLSPEDSLHRLKPADGLAVQLAACEPVIRQPVEAHFDARGRLWVVQYIQYPHPAGAVAMAVDPYLRTRYDISPMPPPHGPVGADKITILDDPDEQGHFRKSKDFVTGLNLATSVEWGYGGVWVLNPPYLLFYPDANRDDVPDGPPVVKLAGFGTDDTHAVASHLTWGPDGWLYGCQGSTCTAHIRDTEFQQAAWRYHPISKRFEVFAEGGGNTFGLEWDAHGNLLTGTNYARFVMVHYVQGGYFIKGFAKHGPLHNPYAFGYFDHVPHTGWRGGHVTQLGVLYQGGALPSKYDGQWIAPNVLTSTIDAHDVRPDGASFTTKFAGELLGSADPAFRPVDIRTGPDGALYVADWYDKRANHVIPEDTWDKDTGRVYRIAPPGLPVAEPFDLEKRTSAQLVDLLSDKNDWYARMARRILAERRDASIIPRLQKTLLENDGRLALQALWALYVSGGLTDTMATELLSHSNADVRAWTVRLLADEDQIAPSLRKPLVDLARTEKSPVVRAQLACSARRLPPGDALPIIRELMLHDEDEADRYIPLLVWWAMEAKVEAGPGEVAALFQTRAAQTARLPLKFLLERLGQRLTMGRTEPELAACAQLLSYTGNRDATGPVLEGMNKGLTGNRAPARVPEALRSAIASLRADQPEHVNALSVAVRLGDAPALQEAARRAYNVKRTPIERLTLIGAIADAGGSDARDALLRMLDPWQVNSDEIIRALLGGLSKFDDPSVARTIVAQYPRFSVGTRPAAVALLLGRHDSTVALLEAIDRGDIPVRDLTIDQARRAMAYRDGHVDDLVLRHWNVRQATEDEKAQAIQKLTVRVGKMTVNDGDARRGKAVFLRTCAVCHAYRGEGARIGPDLTGFGKANIDYLIKNIVDPSALIRPEYASYILRTTDGETLTGMINESPAAVTIIDGDTRTAVPRERIARLEASTVSPMPEKLLEGMTEEQVRDLFAFLTSP